MFEELVRGPEPWLYAHVQLPGGRDNIGNPDYDLKNETSLAPRTGTLMRVARYEKQPDNRWAVWVQGVSRCRVERALRNMPYARARVDGCVRIIPDGEAVLALRRDVGLPGVLVRGATRGRGLRLGRVPAAARIGGRRARLPVRRGRGDGVGRAGLDGICSAPLSVDADARHAADAADGALLIARERTSAEARRAPAAAFQRLADRGARAISNSRAVATGRRLARGLHR